MIATCTITGIYLLSMILASLFFSAANKQAIENDPADMSTEEDRWMIYIPVINTYLAINYVNVLWSIFVRRPLMMRRTWKKIKKRLDEENL